MIEMTRRDILPAIEAFAKDTALTAAAKKSILPDLSCAYEERLVKRLSSLCSEIDERCLVLEEYIDTVRAICDMQKKAEFYRDSIIPVMNELRARADEAETLTSSKYWPFPTYGELLYGIR